MNVPNKVDDSSVISMQITEDKQQNNLAFQSATTSQIQNQLNHLNDLSDTVKNEIALENVIGTINKTIEKYEELIKEHQQQLV